MELQIRPYNKNQFPLSGILLKGNSVKDWIFEIQRLGLNLHEISLYPIPGLTANSVWGCFLLSAKKPDKTIIGKNEFCQQVTQNFFIPEKTRLYPEMTMAEIEKLFIKGICIMHPEFGFAELEEELSFKALLQAPIQKSYYVIRPKSGVFIPRNIKSFQIQPLPPEEVLKNLEENIFPRQEKMKDKPLNLFEKGKLAFYKTLFTKEKGNGTLSDNGKPEKTGFLKRLESFFKPDKTRENSWIDKMQQDFEDLEKRNQKQLDKLMDLLQNNPEEALKYAIPLDQGGTSRGTNNGLLDFSTRWSDFSLFNSHYRSGGGSGSINLGEGFHKLQQQYNQTAEELIKRGNYQKAAFVYLKLLQTPYKAAQTLEEGKHYQEAATIFLKHCNNKEMAAACYEKGNMTLEAIDLYKELNQNEKVGDLYMTICKPGEARVYYEKTIDLFKSQNKYIKASFIYKHKMNEPQGAQSLLLDGWRNNYDAVNCLNNYFNNIQEVNDLRVEIQKIYKRDVTEKNGDQFLRVLQYEFAKKNELAEEVREIAYELVASRISLHPDVVKELKAFNPKDKELTKDTIRFNLNKKKFR